MSDQSHQSLGPISYTEELKAIAGSFTRRELGLFIGAGMSTDSGIPDGRSMAIRMLRRAVLGENEESNAAHPDIDALAERYPFEAIAEFLKQKLVYHDLENWLRDKGKGDFASASPKEAHKYLRELHDRFPNCFPKTIFTTNFDTLIEEEFNRDRPPGEEKACCITSDNLKELPRAREDGKIVVAHLHGSVKYPKSIISGEGLQATLRGAIFDLLRSALATDVFVLVGYSLTDTDLRSLFFEVQEIADTRFGLSKRTFAVSRAAGHPGEKTTGAYIAREIWFQRGHVEHIALSAVDFFRLLYEAVDNFLLVKIRSEVAAALGKDEATLQSMLQSAAALFRWVNPDDLLIYLFYALTPIKKQQ